MFKDNSLNSDFLLVFLILLLFRSLFLFLFLFLFRFISIFIFIFTSNYLIIQSLPFPFHLFPSLLHSLPRTSSTSLLHCQRISLHCHCRFHAHYHRHHHHLVTFALVPFLVSLVFLLRIYIPISFSIPHIFFINSYRLVENVRSSTKFHQIGRGTKHLGSLSTLSTPFNLPTEISILGLASPFSRQDPSQICS